MKPEFIMKHLNVGEFIDRFTVDILVLLNVGGGARELEVWDDFDDFLKGLTEGIDEASARHIKYLVLKLMALNGRIWGLESTIRMGSDCKLPLEEIGRRTMEIRDLNNKRSDVKKMLTARMGILCQKQ